jgi:hypothetical protein
MFGEISPAGDLIDGASRISLKMHFFVTATAFFARLAAKCLPPGRLGFFHL